MREADLGVQFSNHLMRGLDVLKQNGYIDQFEALWDAIRHDALAGVRTLLESGKPSPGLIELAALRQTGYSPEGAALDATFAALFDEELREQAKQHLQSVRAVLALSEDVDDTSELPEADAFSVRYDRAFRLLQKYNIGADLEVSGSGIGQTSMQCLFLSAYIGRSLSLKFTTPDLLELFEAEKPLLHFSLIAAGVSAAPELFPLGEPVITDADLEAGKAPWADYLSGAFGERLSNVVDIITLRSALWELAQARSQTETIQEVLKHVHELGRVFRQQIQQPTIHEDECELALVHSLGEALFYSLGASARQHLVEAERLARIPNLTKPGYVLLEIAFAFENESEELVLTHQRTGNRALGFAEFTEVLRNRSHPLHVALSKQGIDTRALADANEQVRKIRNAVAHGAPFGPEQVRQLKRDWLGENPRRKALFSVFGRPGNAPS